MDEIRERFYRDFQTFDRVSHEYEDGRITAQDYRAVSAAFGEYLQRGDLQMLRIRVPGGRLSISQLKALLDCCRYYHVGNIKITTGQALQLHDLDPHAGRRLIVRLLDAGLVTRGAGGDNPNNVTASPLSGVDREEFFDVLPYAEACDRCLLQYVGTEKLPRKFMMGFCSSRSNDTHVTIKDLGFMANPDHTFDVYAAGGMGVKPKRGLLVARHADPSLVLYYLRAMLDVYMENGDYRNRYKARTRFLQDTMGPDGFRKAFQTRLEEVLREGGHDLAFEAASAKGKEEPEFSSSQPQETGLDKKASCGCRKEGEPLPGSSAQDSHIVPQKQEGLFALPYHPIGGYLSLKKMEEIDKALSPCPKAEIRLTTEGGLYVINLTADEIPALLPVFQDGAQTEFEASIACVGRSRCFIGAADSQALLKSCINAARAAHLPDHVLPRISISGCISSCGETQIGAIGFRGARRRRADGTTFEVYYVSAGGSAAPGAEVLAVGTKAIPADRVPEFLVTLGKQIAALGTTFSAWYPGHTADFEELVDRCSL